ncbi:NAD(P)H-quinone oxidoreductase subunit 3 chloroplastic [Bienertia sinuspersici]
MKKRFQTIALEMKPIPSETNETGLGGILASSSKGPEKLSSYKSGIEPIWDAWLQFRISYYMFSLFMPGEKEHWNCLNLRIFNNKKKKGKKIRLKQLSFY